MARDDIFPEILAAAGVCADFCARPEVWPAFEEWLREDGVSPADEDLASREFLLAVSRVILVLIHQLEAEMIAEKFRLLLSENLKGEGVKYFYLPVPQETPIPCFSCGRSMTFIKGEHARECRDCEVTELRLQGEYVIMTRKITSVMFFGCKVEFIDHSLECRPHP